MTWAAANDAIATSAHALDAIIVMLVPAGIALIVWQIQQGSKRSADQHAELGERVRALDETQRDAINSHTEHELELTHLARKLDEHIARNDATHDAIVDRLNRHLDPPTPDQ